MSESNEVLTVEIENLEAALAAMESSSMFDSAIAEEDSDALTPESTDSNRSILSVKNNINLMSDSGISTEQTIIKDTLNSDKPARNANDEDADQSQETDERTSVSNDLLEAVETGELDSPSKRFIKRVSFVKVLEVSPLKVPNLSFDSTDLDKEFESIIDRAMSTASNEKASRAAQLEQAIYVKREVASPRKHRNTFNSSPINNNANRYCRKPKALSEGGTPTHSNKNITQSNNNRSESYCQMSVTSLNASIALPMDRLSVKLFNPPERAATHLGIATLSPRTYQNGGSCFGGRGRTPRQFIIHPEWVSESLSVQKVPLSDRSLDFADKAKRSQSCPPIARNVITWNTPEKSLAKN